MKFKTIFIIFNGVLIFSFLFIFFVPLFMFNTLQPLTFLKNYWGAAVAFFIVLLGFNYYFIRNLKLFSLLEEEDWTGLMSYLEENIYQKKKIRANWIKILLNTYLITSNIEGTLRLKNYLEKKHYRYIARYSLQFSIPYLLNKEPGKAEEFYSRLINTPETRNKDWIRWNLGVNLLNQKKIEAGKQELLKLKESIKDPVLQLLNLYVLKAMTAGDTELSDYIQSEVELLRNRYSYRNFEKLIEEQKNNVQLVFLAPILNQAQKWLYGLEEPEEEGFQEQDTLQH